MFVDDVEDDVRLGDEGWKGRYYTSKFGDRIHEEGFHIQYVEVLRRGLQWVLRYYYKGCPSWAWFYPYHYSPFASDLRDIEQYGPIEFPPSSPFTPIEQLMSVLPPPSAHCLPKACQTLMTSPTSPILDFYPETFELDPNGKGVSWLWIALLPFIDADRLQKHVKLVSPFFSPKEVEHRA